MIDWKTKLTSRKFWFAVVGFVSGILVAFKVDSETVETISGIIMSAASVIAYIIGEGLSDAAGAKAASFVAMQEAREKAPDWDEVEDQGEDLE